MDKLVLREVFSEFFSSPCQSFHQLLQTDHYQSYEACKVSQTVAHIPSGLSRTTPKETKKTITIIIISSKKANMDMRHVLR
jgi:hypothetical protein